MGKSPQEEVGRLSLKFEPSLWPTALVLRLSVHPQSGFCVLRVFN